MRAKRTLGVEELIDEYIKLSLMDHVLFMPPRKLQECFHRQEGHVVQSPT